MPRLNSRVFISAAEILVPPAQALKDFLPQFLEAQSAMRATQTKINDQIYIESLELKLDASNPHHPSVRDVKSMRVDVVAMCICMGKMLEKYGPSNWAEVPLFLSAGASASGLTEEIQGIYSLLRNHISSDESRRNQQVNRDIHPLFALKALTNSAQAYAAQFFGFRGQNTTFGSTSNAGLHSLLEGFEAIQCGDVDRVVVGASNGGGFFSQLMGIGLAPEGQSFRESPVAVAMILESEKCFLQREKAPVCEIFEIKSSSRLPQFELLEPSQTYFEFKKGNYDQAIFSGGACFENWKTEQTSVNSHWKKSWSPYPVLGGTGCTSFLLNIALAFQMLEENLVSNIDCLDTDTYFRESRVQLGRALPV